MKRPNRLVPLAPWALFASVTLSASMNQACGDPPIDDSRGDLRLFPVKGVIQGTVTYQGLRPCSRNGHIVGNAIMLVFDRRNPPPPAGLANTAINFGVVTGDALFANEPRNTGTNTYCPKDVGEGDTVLATAPFVIAPMDPGSYVMQAFYDYTGNFLPTFKMRNLPEQSDVAGGYFDVADALKNGGNASYQPHLLPIDIGTPLPLPPNASPDTIPAFTMPYEGFVRDNVAVTLTQVLPFTRPYFYPTNPSNSGPPELGGPGIDVPGVKLRPDFADTAEKPGDPNKPHPGSTEADPYYMPLLTMTQDHRVYAQPKTKTSDNIVLFQSSFKQITFRYGVSAAEREVASDVTRLDRPFHMQLGPTNGFELWANTRADGTIIEIPEGGGVPQIWPLVVLAKLQDDVDTNGNFIAGHAQNPQGIIPQGSRRNPVVIIQGLTLLNDSLADTGAGGTPPTKPGAPLDHFTAMVRPSVVCFNANQIDAGGILVTPYEKGPSPDPAEGERLIVDKVAVRIALGKLVREVRFACMPKGRYGMNVVYPDGQAWTSPNEAGSCGGTEGTTVFPSTDAPTDDPAQITCTIKPRSVLLSQGNRAILEIVEAADPAFCKANAVPDECLPCIERQHPELFPQECGP
jgi:hypothetical protein